MTAVSRAGNFRQGLVDTTWKAKGRISGISFSGTPGAAFAVYWATGDLQCSPATSCLCPARDMLNHKTHEMLLGKKVDLKRLKLKLKKSLFWKIILWVLQNLERERESSCSYPGIFQSSTKDFVFPQQLWKPQPRLHLKHPCLFSMRLVC